jgi:hypothetical protein
MAYNPQPDQPVLSSPSALRGCYRLWWLRQQMTEAVERTFRAFTTSDTSDELPDLTSWRHTDRQEDLPCR